MLSYFTLTLNACHFWLLTMLTALLALNHRLAIIDHMIRTTHIRHKVLSTDTELVSIALIVGGLVVAMTKLLN